MFSPVLVNQHTSMLVGLTSTSYVMSSQFAPWHSLSTYQTRWEPGYSVCMRAHGSSFGALLPAYASDR